MAVTAKDNHAPGYRDNPGHMVQLLACPKRLRASLAGETVFDTTSALIMRETGHVPVYYVPRGDARMELMEKTGHGSYCPYKGHASYYSLKVGDRLAENAVWSYEAPYDEARQIEGRLAFYWGKLDHWYEEDDEVFVHARDPHVRVDILESHRPVEVIAGGETVASTTRARFLFETGHPIRYYIPREDVRAELLTPSASHTSCPYKGTASYHGLKLADRVVEDAVWYYPEPIDESRRIAGYLCFYPEKVDAIRVDGKPAP